jgi:DNA-binding CsgD family transcriptional regulator
MLKGCGGASSVAPLMPRGEMFDLAGRRLALVIASRLSGPVTPEQRLRQVFGLTAAEARLAAELAAGKTLDDVSEGREVSLATVRIQFRSVFQNRDGASGTAHATYYAAA